MQFENFESVEDDNRFDIDKEISDSDFTVPILSDRVLYPAR